MKALLTGAIAAFVLLGGIATANQIIYGNSFEQSDNQAYVPDASVVGVDNWLLTSTAGSAVIKTDSPADGAQFVRLSDQAILNRTFDAPTAADEIKGIVWVQGYFRGVGSNSTLAAAEYGSTPASAIVHFSQTNGIELLNGNGDGTGTSVSASVPIEAANWYKITIRLNFDTKKWDVWINNNQSASYRNLGFRDNSVTRLGGFKNLAQQQADFDGFRIVKPSVGDANGDATTDVADLVAVIDHTITNDPIVQGNGDIDRDGDVDAADEAALIGDLTAQ